MTLVKICGLKTPDAMTAALEAGADFVGLVFVPSSPRFVAIEVASYLARYVPATVKIVGLFADLDAQTRTQILENIRLDIIQLHGQETPEECATIRAATSLPVIKALSVDRLDEIPAYEAVCDWLLIDAPPPAARREQEQAQKRQGGADAPGTPALSGGHGRIFDWGLLKGRRFSKPWMLAGGLNADNVGAAIARTAPDAVDVSSGVESGRGEKDPEKIRRFIEAVRRTG